MTRAQALNVLKPDGNTLEAVKSAYRKAAFKYHPDHNPNGLEMMKLINEAFEMLKKTVGQWSFENTPEYEGGSIDEVLMEIFEQIKHFPGLQAEVCGSWLWVRGATYDYKKELKAMGMRFAGKKKAWYWRPEDYQKFSKKPWSMDKIREKYGSVDLDSEELCGVAA